MRSHADTARRPGVPKKNKSASGQKASNGHQTERTGIALMQESARNKGTAFTEAERDALGLRGLLPPRVLTIEQQAARVLENFRRKPNDIEKYIQLMALQGRNETLFYRILLDNVEEMIPIV